MSNRLNELKNMSPEQLLARAGAVLPPWVALLLVLAIAWQLVRVTWLLFPQSNANYIAPERSVPERSQQTTQAYEVGRIVAANLFGQRPTEEELEILSSNLDDVNDTQLNLTLRGTISASGDQVALAIIADDRGEENVYAVGDAVSGGRKLHSVQEDEGQWVAILEHNGELEALRLPRDYEARPTTTARSSRNNRPSPARPAASRIGGYRRWPRIRLN